jgi:hypothetical protein
MNDYKPTYIIKECAGALTSTMLEQLLEALPFRAEISSGHDLSLTARIDRNADKEAILEVRHFAQVIELKPEQGKRLSDGALGGRRGTFSPSRIMDECTGGGACCSYSFNTRDLGLSYNQELMLDIKKLG